MRRRRARGKVRAITVTVLAVLLVLLSTAAGLYWKRPQPPFAALERANQAIGRAHRARADEYCPERVRAAEDTLETAWRLLRDQNRRLYFARDFSVVWRAAERARLAAASAETTSVSLEDSLRHESAESIKMAELVLADVRARVALMSPEHVDRRRLTRLEVNFEQVRQLHRQSAYRESLTRARRLADEAARLEKEASQTLKLYTAEEGRWRHWADETIRWTRQTGGTAIIVDKIGHNLDLYQSGKLIRSYRADLGSDWMGQKLHMGDNATPEGQYKIASKKGPRETKYYKALLLNYPNDEDRRRFAWAKRNGKLTRRASIGGLIEIHGHGGRGQDWTQGCVALDNKDMDHLFGHVSVGTPVTIVGSLRRMN